MDKMPEFLYAGGYSDKINTLSFENGKFELISQEECLNPSFLCYHPTKNICYAATECADMTKISAFKIEENRTLKFIKSVQTDGGGLCHITASEKAVYGADYNSGHVVAYKLAESGEPTELFNLIKHNGGSTHKRQEAPHVHQVVIDKGGEWLIAADLGTNCIHSYKINSDGSLDENSVKISIFPKYAGPRHLVFKNSSTAYLLSELSNTVFRLSYNQGGFEIENSLPLIDKEDTSISAEIDFMPNTEFLYASVRGEDKIFIIDTADSKDEIIGSFDCGGKSPRMFEFSKDGKYLFVANQDSENICTFEMDVHSGQMLKSCAETFIKKATYIGTAK